MDLDALTDARRAEWARLDQLARSRRLSGAEIDELVTRYRAASADLADIKTTAGRTAEGDYVSLLLARARRRLTGRGENPLRQVPRFFVWQLPAALSRLQNPERLRVCDHPTPHFDLLQCLPLRPCPLLRGRTGGGCAAGVSQTPAGAAVIPCLIVVRLRPLGGGWV